MVEDQNVVSLTYWNGRGKAEGIRLLLAVCGVTYSEHVPHQDASVTHLTTKEHVETLRASGDLLMNQLPLLKMDGLNLVQSGAIKRYLGKKYKLMGDGSAAQEALCDMLTDSVADWRTMGCGAFEFSLSYKPSEEQKEKLAKCNAKYLPLFERQLKKNGTGFLCGDSLTLPDYMVFEHIEETEVHTDFTEYPLIKELHKKVKDVPAV
jgi:glutathione S-transferase